MPIVTVQIVLANDERRYANTTVQALSDSLGELFGSDPGSTWVKFVYLADVDYAENHSVVPATVRPTFVEVLKATLVDQVNLAKEAASVAEKVATALSRPRSNVHVLYLPPAEGRIAFGGVLVQNADTE